MPYYRIVIWVNNERYRKEGIRYLENGNIDAVQNMMRLKAREHYGFKLKDVEVQMLPKGCSAVIKYKEQVNKKKEEKKIWGEVKQEEHRYLKPESRRSEYAKKEKISLGERIKQEQDSNKVITRNDKNQL